MVSTPSPNFWHGRRVLLTGSTGFKGGWLAIWLDRMGAEVTGLALPPLADNLFGRARIDTILDHHIVDIRNGAALMPIFASAQPEIVLHLAAQSLVRASYREPVETFATNVLGTVNVLEACRAVDGLKSIVAVTTDKVYHNAEHVLPYRENDRLGGYDPYSASKAACEIAIDSYRASFLQACGIGVASARAGNVIGGGDWSEDRLLPDAVRAWAAGRTLEIRRPDAVRPWQHVLDPLAGYLVLAERLHADPEVAGAYNFGPLTHEAADVRTVVEIARQSYGTGEVRLGASEGPHEAGLLTLETAKARNILNVSPRWPLNEAVDRTMSWYRCANEGADARALCDRDIDAWEAAAWTG